MIGQLKGKISHKDNSRVILDTGGVGYKIHLEQELCDSLKEGDDLSVWTHLSVRENALDLYGFETTEKLVFFEHLITISGIGPKSAMSILDIASLELLKRAVRTGETATLTKVAGIGKKNAEKIILELRGKLGTEQEEDGHPEKFDLEVYEALTSLGYSSKEAREAVAKIPEETEGTEKRIKEALKYLGS
ncbi:MAG: Holliday junction branch migration protein RuvA [Patescibacteria group bacterium]